MTGPQPPGVGSLIESGWLPHPLGVTTPFLRLASLPLLTRGDARLDPRLVPFVERLQPDSEAREREGPIPMLTTLFPDGHPDIRREVYQAHPGLGPVLVLSAGAAGPECLDTTLGQQGFVALGNRDRGRIGHGWRERTKWRTIEAMVRVEGTR